MNKVTVSDIMRVAGGFALGIDYTGRFIIRMTDEVDPAILADAIEKTNQRYPYLSVRIMQNEQCYYYEENPEPIALLHTDAQVTLNAPETNYHVWSVCYLEDKIILDCFHGIFDGTGMYKLLSTLLYYYCAGRYGVTEHKGIWTLEDEIDPAETIDPLEELKLEQPPQPGARPQPGFSLIKDAGFTPSQTKVWDLEVPEADFVKFCQANDASPGSMVSVLFAQSIDELYPERSNAITQSYVVNARPMLKAEKTHHNCMSNVTFKYNEVLRTKSLERQCLIHRGCTMVQTMDKPVINTLAATAERNRKMLMPLPPGELKNVCGKMMSVGKDVFTYTVSYIGRWPYKEIGKYIKEFWTHAPSANLLIELGAVNGRMFISVHQDYEEEDVLQAFLKKLEDNGIGYQMKEPVTNDIARFPEP